MRNTNTVARLVTAFSTGMSSTDRREHWDFICEAKGKAEEEVLADLLQQERRRHGVADRFSSTVAST